MSRLRRKTIRVKKSEFLDAGAFADVYKISPRRVVKVFNPYDFSEEEIDWLVEDEIKGSKADGHVPVLRKVNVYLPGKRKPTPGLIKRFIPYEIDNHDIPYELDYWDNHKYNFRQDSKGNVFIIDSQSEDAMNYGS